MRTFKAEGNNYYLGMPICHGKRPCEIVIGITHDKTTAWPNYDFDEITVREMNEWELVGHELGEHGYCRRAYSECRREFTAENTEVDLSNTLRIDEWGDTICDGFEREHGGPCTLAREHNPVAFVPELNKQLCVICSLEYSATDQCPIDPDDTSCQKFPIEEAD